jgi:hypothetical protein
MKSLFLLLFAVLFSNLLIAQRDYTQNPYWLIDHLKATGATFKSSGQISIGKANNSSIFAGPPPVNHVIKTISITIPKDATIKKIYPFIVNIDGLKGPGGEPTLIPWGTTPEQDVRWGMFHSPASQTKSNGEIEVSVTYDNWSDIETRAGFLVVEYSLGTTTTHNVSVNNSTSNPCTNSVWFYNPAGSSTTVFLYTAKVDNGSVFDFCSVASAPIELPPNHGTMITFTSDKVLVYQSYDRKECLGNYLVTTGSLSNQCCITKCEIAVGH